MSRIDVASFRVREGNDKFDLLQSPTLLPKTPYGDKQDYKTQLATHKSNMLDLQEALFASGRRGLLFGVQAMDTAGKDGLMEHVFTGLNPQGCEVTSFKRPTEIELKHHYLWRHEVALPSTGIVGVWNRTHYEEVGIVRVHPEFLKARNIEASEAGKRFWNNRLEEIKEWEHRRHDGGISIVKIFLNISKREQAQRLLARAEDPEKQWKFNLGDMEERKLWKNYMHAYSEAISATSTDTAPWYVVPADDKRAARLIVAEIVNHHLEAIGSKPPQLGRAARNALKEVAVTLRAELGGED